MRRIEQAVITFTDFGRVRVSASAILVVFLAVIPLLSSGQTKPDIIIFDEGDPMVVGYYDPSVPAVTPPSQVTTFLSPYGGKMPLLGSVPFTGSQSGLLQWKSAPGGDWSVFVASPGFQIHNATGYSNVVFFINGPKTIAAGSLPKAGMESSTDQKTALVPLGVYLPDGMDGDTNTWQRVSVPLIAFQPYGLFSLTQFKDVFFAQNTADNVTNTVWLDNLRLTDGHTPSAPS